MTERMSNERAKEELALMRDNLKMDLQETQTTHWTDNKTTYDKRVELITDSIQALNIAIDSLDNEWRTDTPQESGFYLVTNGANKLDIRKYDSGWYHDMYRRYTNEELKVVAWKKFEPYERKEV